MNSNNFNEDKLSDILCQSIFAKSNNLVFI